MFANTKKALEEEIGQLEKKANGILDKAEAEKRSTTDAENKEFEAALAEIEKKKAELKTVEAQHNFRKSQAANAGLPVNGGPSEQDKRDFSKFSIVKAINQLSKRAAFEGVEAEIINEGRKEAREAGMTAEGVTIPSQVIAWGKRNEKRDLTVTTEGTDVVQTTLGGMIPILAPTPIVQSLGAQMLTGLQGDFQLPRHNGAASLAWEGETDANAETTPTMDKVVFTPNRVGGYIDYSQKLLRQSSPNIEAFVRNELNRVLALEIDATAIYGAGSGNQPEGIINITGIGDVALGTDGGAPTWAMAVNLMREVDIDNALMGSVHFLTNPKVKAKLMQTPRQTSGVEGNFIMNEANSLIGYNVGISNQVPSNLEKGSSGTVCSAMIFGNFADLFIAQWGGIDLLVDPYTQATSGLVRVVINAYMDVKVRHAQSFAACQDILTT